MCPINQQKMSYQPIIPIHIDVRGAVSQLDSLTKQLNEDELKKATSRAINRTIIHLRATIVKQIPQVYALKGFQVRDRFDFFKANKNSLTGKVLSVSNRINANNFQSTLIKGGVSTKITNKKKGGQVVKTTQTRRKADSLFIKIYKGGGTKEVKNAFALTKGGSLFFAFRGKYKKTDEYQKAMFDKPSTSFFAAKIKRHTDQVQSLLTQSVWDMAINDKVQFPTAQDGTIFFAKRFEAEVNNLIRLKTQIP